MSRTAATARRTTTHRHAAAATHRAGVRRAPAPPPRRVSGPAVSRAVPAGAVALPRARTLPGIGGVRSLPDHGFLDALLRSRAWIWLIGALLGGIVAMQVSLLKLNSGISRAVESAATLEHQNAELEAQVARLSSGERIAAAAGKRGMVMPDAGTVRYLDLRGGDVGRALRRMQAPSAAAKALMAAGGVATVPGALPAAPVTPVAQPQAQATPAVTPQATPHATPQAVTPQPVGAPPPAPGAATTTTQTAPAGQG